MKVFFLISTETSKWERYLEQDSVAGLRRASLLYHILLHDQLGVEFGVLVISSDVYV